MNGSAMTSPQPATGLRSLRVYLDMIKIEHSIFALPFAMIGMIWAAHGWPGWRTFGLIVLAMVTCRSAAMAYNRIADRDIDALNPRTKVRALPAGLLTLRTASLYFFGSVALFLTAAALLNPLTLSLSPIALLVTLGYSRTKRFTPLCHFVLGLSLGVAPAAAWIAVTGSIDWRIVPLTMAVMLWTAGFDILYALQDDQFDRDHRLRSIPETLGRRTAINISRMCHVFAIAALLIAGGLVGAGPIFSVAVIAAGLALFYEQSLVKVHDLSKLNVAFFTMNGVVAIVVFVGALLDLLQRKGVLS